MCLEMASVTVIDTMLRIIVSYNGRGLSDSKQAYLRHSLADCDILFLQEHRLSEGELGCLNALRTEHVSATVNGLGNNCVLSGCEIFWRKAPVSDCYPVDTNSGRICETVLK